MKNKPLMIIAAFFAVSFAGRALGVANTAIGADKSGDEKAEAAMKEKKDAGKDIAMSDGHTKNEPSKNASDKMKKDGDGSHNDQTHDKPYGSDHNYGHTVMKEMDDSDGEPTDRAQYYSKLLSEIRERAMVLDKREEKVENRLRELEIIEGRIEEKLSALKAANEDLVKRIAYANEASKDDISQLAKMYEQMKPQKAGEIFNSMDATFAAGFLTQMNSESAAAILTNMSTEKAYAASMMIASRNAAVNQE